VRDKPDAAQLLDSVEAFLTGEVVAQLTGRRRFHALVAANAVRIVARELRLGPGQDAEELLALWRLLGRDGDPPPSADLQSLLHELNTELCVRIDRGDADSGEFRVRVASYLACSVEAKLKVDNPKALDSEPV
jgi:hypothetical protein